jgi:hypothetical protein
MLSEVDGCRRKNNRSTGTRKLQWVGSVGCVLSASGVKVFRLLLFEVSIALTLIQVFYLSSCIS